MKPAGLLLALLAFLPLSAATRRAVVVGIDVYLPPGAAPPRVPEPSPRAARLRGQWNRTGFSNLGGAVADAARMRELLVGRFGFDSENIVCLRNEQATAAAILRELQTRLVEAAAPGDMSFFYFAGHGSLIRNQHGAYDQTLVAADAWRGTPDIRDKELALLLHGATARGVRLTVVVDACHSGSILRGTERVRFLPEDGRWVEDPEDTPAPEQEGALVLSAAQEYQTAAEVKTPSGLRGAFSLALFEVLEALPRTASAARVFAGTRARLQARTEMQEPVLAGRGSTVRTLFGELAEKITAFRTVAARVFPGAVELDAGLAAGLNPGCRLRRVAPEGRSPVTLRVDRLEGLAHAHAVILGDAATLRKGDEFEVTEWTAPPARMLRLYAPADPPPQTEIERVAALARTAAGTAWVDDPGAELPLMTLRWEAPGWVLESAAGSVRLPPGFAAAELARRLDPARRFYFWAPFPGLSLEKTAGALTLARTPADAAYQLRSRFTAAGFAYAWTRCAGVDRAMPPHSPWVPAGNDAAGALSRQAGTLARLYGWLRLEAPGGSAPYPYRPVFRTLEGKPAGRRLRQGCYRLMLEAEEAPGSLEGVRRALYLLTVDPDGSLKLLFPRPDAGNSENFLPAGGAAGEAPRTFALPAKVCMRPPFGVETLFLVTSSERIDPHIFASARAAEEIERGAPGAWSVTRLNVLTTGDHSLSR